MSNPGDFPAPPALAAAAAASNPTAAALPKTLDLSEADLAELEQLEQRDAEREKTAEKAAQARRLDELRLVEQLRGQLGGERGQAFEVVNTPWGVWGVRKPDSRGLQAFDREMKKDESDPVKLVEILRHYIVPEDRKLAFHAVGSERDGVVLASNSVGMAFLSLAGRARFDAKKK